MKRSSLCFVLLFFPASSFAGTCDQLWLHVVGISKHIEVFQPNEFTRYKRQSHPGFGVECTKKQYAFAFGEFTNSLNKPFLYLIASKAVFQAGKNSNKLKLNAGVLAGEYGRTVRQPLRLATPIAYMDYQYQNIGLNFCVLPPLRGVNDYIILYTQFKLRY